MCMERGIGGQAKEVQVGLAVPPADYPGCRNLKSDPQCVFVDLKSTAPRH